MYLIVCEISICNRYLILCVVAVSSVFIHAFTDASSINCSVVSKLLFNRMKLNVASAMLYFNVLCCSVMYYIALCSSLLQ